MSFQNFSKNAFCFHVTSRYSSVLFSVIIAHYPGMIALANLDAVNYDRFPLNLERLLFRLSVHLYCQLHIRLYISNVEAYYTIKGRKFSCLRPSVHSLEYVPIHIVWTCTVYCTVHELLINTFYVQTSSHQVLHVGIIYV